MNRRGVTAAVVLAVSTACQSEAAERHVPSQYGTIQAAIDACSDGDTVIVADGTYTGDGNKNLDFGGGAITVRSASGDPNTCVIDCEGDGRGFYFDHHDTASVLNGFTITNGHTDGLPGGSSGGAIWCGGDSSPSITDCIVSESYASNAGGGI